MSPRVTCTGKDPTRLHAAPEVEVDAVEPTARRTERAPRRRTVACSRSLRSPESPERRWLSIGKSSILTSETMSMPGEFASLAQRSSSARRSFRGRVKRTGGRSFQACLASLLDLDLDDLPTLTRATAVPSSARMNGSPSSASASSCASSARQVVKGGEADPERRGEPRHASGGARESASRGRRADPSRATRRGSRSGARRRDPSAAGRLSSSSPSCRVASPRADRVPVLPPTAGNRALLHRPSAAGSPRI